MRAVKGEASDLVPPHPQFWYYLYIYTYMILYPLGEFSAYSVFNPHQQKIVGTFDDKDMVPLILVS